MPNKKNTNQGQQVELTSVLVRLPDAYKEQLGAIIRPDGRKLKNLSELHDEAVLDFLKWRQSDLAPRIFFYCASSTAYPLRPVALSEDVEKAASEQAKADGVSVRQVVLTALVRLVDSRLK